MDLNGLLARVIELGGSDLHLKVASPAMARVDGELIPMEERLLTSGDLETLVTLVTELTPAKREEFYTHGELDTAYMVDGIGRFRVNGYRQRGAISFAFRFIPKEIPSFEKLGLPPGVEALAQEHRGLVLVTGATGSGKSTTLAAIVNSINRSRKHHIVTIGRYVEFFPPGKHDMVRQILAGVLRGVVSQRLLPRAAGGRIAAVEVMVANARIADLVRENRADVIPEAIADGKFFQMQTFMEALVELVVTGV